jgi:hypothetical protein
MCESRSVTAVVHLELWPCSGAGVCVVTLHSAGEAPQEYWGRELSGAGWGSELASELAALAVHLEESGGAPGPF